MRNWKRNIGIAVLIFGIMVFLPLLIPTKSYLKQLEVAISDQINQPVRIESLYLSILPTPRIKIKGFVMGSEDDLVVPEIEVIPDVLTLLSKKIVISELDVEEPIVKQSAINFIKEKLTEKRPRQSASYSFELHNIVFNRMKLIWPNVNLMPISIKMHLDDDFNLVSLEGNSDNNDLHLNVLSDHDSFLIKLGAENWQLPYGKGINFDNLNALMVFQGDALDIKQFKAKIFDGTLDLHAGINWRKDWQCHGKFNTDHLSTQKLFSVITASASPLSGFLSGAGSFESESNHPNDLLNRLKLRMRFNVEDGVLHGVDLLNAAKLIMKQNQSNDETKFDEFSGDFDMASQQYNFNDLNVSSGLLEAKGYVKVSPVKSLDGEVKVSFKRSVTLTEIPLRVSGTVSHPVVLPTKSAMAGAVAGTALLGPGLGTSIGIKASEATKKLEKFFGSQ